MRAQLSVFVLALVVTFGLWVGCSRPDVLVPEPEGAELAAAFPPIIGSAGRPFRPEPSELGPLEVVNFGPRGPLESSPHFSIRFSVPIVALGSAEYREAAPLLETEPPMALKTRWEAPDLLTAEPIDALPVGSPYTLKLAAGLKDATGTRTLAEELIWEIETERPALVSVSPWDGELDISPTTPFILTFNGAVSAEELAKFVSVEAELPQYPVITEVTNASHYEETLFAPPYAVAVSVSHTVCPGNTEFYTLSPEHCVEVRPKAALPWGAFVTLRLAAGFVSTEGPLPAELGAASTFSVREPFRLVSATCWDECSPDSTIELEFSHNFKEDSAFETYVSMSPGKLTERVWSFYSTLSMQPLTKPNSNHTIKIKRGLESNLGEKLGPISLKLHVGEYRPEITTQGQLTILDSESPHSLVASMSYVKKPKVELAFLPNDDVVKTLSTLEWTGDDEEATKKFDALPALESVKIEQHLRKNDWNLDELRIPLEMAVAKNQTGSILYKVSHEDTLQPPQYAVVIFTKLALSVIGDGEKAALLVTDLGTASSLRDVTIELRGRDNTTYWTGVTPADGTLELPSRTSFGLDYDEPLWIVAHKGNDQSVLRLSYGGTSTTALAGHLVAERKIYRPGDTLYFKGFPRLLTPKGLRSPAREGSSVAVQLVGVDGEVVSTQTLTLTVHGNFSGQFEVPKNSRLGWVSLYARLTDGGALIDGSLSEQVKVAEFRTPQFEVEVRPIHDEIARGQKLEVLAVGRYLHGAAMSDGKVTLRVDPNRTYHRPEGYNSYQFTPFEESRTEDLAFTEADLDLDARGESLLQHLVEGQQVSAQRYLVEAEVYDVDRQAVASSSSVLVHPGLFYLGSRFIRPEETYAAVIGKPVTAEVIAVGWKDELYAWKDVKSLHLRIEGPAPTEETDPPQLVVDCDPKPVGDSLPTCTVTPNRVGRWLVRTTATDSLGNTLLSEADIAVFAESTERHAGQVSARPPYGLSRDKDLYQPGETAKLTLGSADAMVRGIFAVSADGLRSWHLVDIKDGGFAGTTSKDIALGVEQLPGVNAEVLLIGERTTYTLMDGYDSGRPTLLHDREPLPMDVESQRLSVEVESSTASARPGDELSVTLVVRDRDGLVVPDAEVTLWAVDAGIVLLQPFELPDLLGGLFPRRSAGTWWGETRNFLGYQLGFSNPTGGGGMGYGSGMGSLGSRSYGGAGGAASGPVAARKKFVTTPYYNGEIITDAEGKATIHFTLPDNLTRFELFAMASEGVTRFGKGKSSVEVSLPLLLRPALPRFANLGDHLEAGVIVQNNSEESVVAQVTASSTGLLSRTVPSVKPESVSLEPGRSAEVRFAWLASQTGTETLRFDVATATERDAVEVSLPVQERILDETVAVYGVIEQAVAIPLMLPFAVFADRGGLDLSVSSTRLTGLADAARYLIDYPHGCLEQTSSRLAPLILLGELGPDLTGVTADDVKPMIDAGLERLQTMAMPGGGFSYWPGNGNPTHPFASLYATLILADAQAAGYDTLGLLEPSLNYARALVLPTTAPATDSSTDVTDQAWIEKAFALYVLASQDAIPDESLLGAVEMAKKPVGKPIFARFMLYRALRGIEPSRLPGEDLVGIAEALLISAENQIVEEGRAAHIKEIAGLGRWMDSEHRSDAIALDVLLQVQPDHPMIEKLAIGLLDARQSGRWRSTQENAWALRAMVRYLNVVESAVPNFDMTAWYDGEPMLSHHFEGRSADKIESHLPITAVIEADGKPVLIGKKGEGRLYYRLGMTYAPKDQNLPAWDAGFSVTREYSVNGVRLEAGTPLNAGDIVKVNITLDCPSRRYYVALVDPLPAAFEPIDTTLATTGSSAVRVVRWSEFNHNEMRDNRVEYFADELAAGSHVLQYEARVTSAGQFRAGATVVEEMYTPEVFGRGEPMDLEVR